MKAAPVKVAPVVDPVPEGGESATPKRAKRVRRVRKEDVVSEARRLFAERGYEGLTMGELAERVGLRKASLFHYFPTKEALYARVLGDLVDTVDEVLRAALAPGPLDVQLDAVTDGLAVAFGAQPDVARLLVREALEDTPSVGRALGTKIDDVLARARELVIRGQREGVFERDLDPTHVIVSLVGVYLMPFAMGRVVERFAGMRPGHAAFVSARAVAVRDQVRRLFLTRPSR